MVPAPFFMSPKSLVPEPTAICPLTPNDYVTAGCITNISWLMTGHINEQGLKSGLRRLTDKWRVLSGRLEQVQNTNGKRIGYRLRVPLGPLPNEYESFILTTTTSTRPITDYLSLPLPTSHTPLPSSLLRHEGTPNTCEPWITQSLPLLLWHLTYFPALPPHFLGTNEYSKEGFTCVGLSFPHVAFDGCGSSIFLHALEAELNGREWRAPVPLQEGMNINPLEDVINTRLRSLEEKNPGKKVEVYERMCGATMSNIKAYRVWNIWKNWCHGVERRVFTLPSEAVGNFVDCVKKEIELVGCGARVTTGDILTAWLFKSIYEEDPIHPETIMFPQGASSARAIGQGALDNYLHNCITLLPYSPIRISELRKKLLYEFVIDLATARESRNPDDIVSACELQRKLARDPRFVSHFFHPKGIDEPLTMSNKTVFKMADLDMSAVGGGNTICTYRSLLIGDLQLNNNLAIAGWLKSDKKLVVESMLSKIRTENIERAVVELEQKYGRSVLV